METTKKEEITIVQRVSDGKYNLIDANGKILSEQWFKWIGFFDLGIAKVKREDGKFNYITKDGKLLSDEWFKWVDYFNDGFAKVQRTNGEYFKIDKQGKILVVSE